MSDQDETGDFAVEIAVNASREYEFTFSDTTEEEAYNAAFIEAVEAFKEALDVNPNAYLAVQRVSEIEGEPEDESED